MIDSELSEEVQLIWATSVLLQSNYSEYQNASTDSERKSLLSVAVKNAELLLILDTDIGDLYWAGTHQLVEVIDCFTCAGKVFALNDDGEKTVICYRRLQDHMVRLTPKLPDLNEWLEYLPKRE